MWVRPNSVQVCLSPVDFRKNMDTLALLVSRELGANPLSGTMFVFFNRGLDKVKILQYDRHGFWLCYKRLERGRFVLDIPTHEKPLFRRMGSHYSGSWEASFLNSDSESWEAN